MAVHTGEDALVFARLLTNQEFYLPETLGGEIQPDGTITGMEGHIAAKILADTHYVAPHAVRLSDEQWLVSRTILTASHDLGARWQIDTVLEKIGSSGGYQLLDRSPQFTGKIDTLPVIVPKL